LRLDSFRFDVGFSSFFLRSDLLRLFTWLWLDLIDLADEQGARHRMMTADSSSEGVTVRTNFPPNAIEAR